MPSLAQINFKNACTKNELRYGKLHLWRYEYDYKCNSYSLVTCGVRRKFSWGGFIQWHRVVICIWCALFVMSQFDVIVLFPSQRFGEVCWHNMHIFLYIHSSYFMCQCTEYINY